MSETNMKSETYQITAEPMADKSVKKAVKDGLQNKTVQVSLLSIATLAACGAVGYALTRPSNRRRMSRYTDQISGVIPGLTRKTSRTERLANQIVDLVDAAFKR